MGTIFNSGNNINRIMSKEETKNWTDDDMIVFANWYRIWRTHPKVGSDAYTAFKNWKKLKKDKDSKSIENSIIDYQEVVKKLGAAMARFDKAYNSVINRQVADVNKHKDIEPQVKQNELITSYGDVIINLLKNLLIHQIYACQVETNKRSIFKKGRFFVACDDILNEPYVEEINEVASILVRLLRQEITVDDIKTMDFYTSNFRKDIYIKNA